MIGINTREDMTFSNKEIKGIPIDNNSNYRKIDYYFIYKGQNLKKHQVGSKNALHSSLTLNLFPSIEAISF